MAYYLLFVGLQRQYASIQVQKKINRHLNYRDGLFVGNSDSPTVVSTPCGTAWS